MSNSHVATVSEFTTPGAYPLPIEIIDPITWQDKPVPERRFVVPEMIPVHNVTKVSGDGGMGKSLLLMQLLVASALEKRWLGRPTLACRAFGLFARTTRANYTGACSTSVVAMAPNSATWKTFNCAPESGSTIR